MRQNQSVLFELNSEWDWYLMPMFTMILFSDVAMFLVDFLFISCGFEFGSGSPGKSGRDH